METEFWHNAWQGGKTGWQQRRVNTRLQRHWPELQATKTLADQSGVGSLLVPMCGDSPDLIWLADQSPESRVVGCELSELAVLEFFETNQLKRTSRRLSDEHTVYQASNISILCGDYFSLSPTTFEQAGLPQPVAAYDRAAQVAMPGSMRRAYAKKYAQLLPGTAQILMLTLSYDQEKMKGPPFSVSDAEIEDLYSSHFDITVLAQSSGPDILGNLSEKGLDTCSESVFCLTRKLTPWN